MVFSYSAVLFIAFPPSFNVLISEGNPISDTGLGKGILFCPTLSLVITSSLAVLQTLREEHGWCVPGQLCLSQHLPLETDSYRNLLEL